MTMTASPLPAPNRCPAFGAGFRLGRTAVALVVIVVVVAAAFLAPWLAPFDPLSGDGALRLLPPGTDGHLLGLDAQGRDVLSRLLWGARPSLIAGVVPVAAALAISLVLGLLAGYTSSFLGGLIMRVIDALFAFPMILFAIATVSLLGPGLTTIIVTITVSLVPYMTRIVYGAVVGEIGKGYLETARLLGASRSQVLFKELLPNVVSPSIVYATTLIGPMIGFSSGLSFLGLGIQPPNADWGRMTVEGVEVFAQGAPHVVLAAGIAIIVTSLAFNWLGSGLRDILDPQQG